MSVPIPARGLGIRGRVVTGWGPRGAHHEDGLVIVDGGGRVVTVAPYAPPPATLAVLGDPGRHVVPGITDAHVHLSFGAPAPCLAAGVTAVRDLGAPPADALRWRGSPAPVVAVAGPLLTAPGGYPANGWGAGGFARGVATPALARAAVAALAGDGVDVIKLALEPAGGQPVPPAAVAAAVVAAAHEHGLAVTCHALRTGMVERALDAGVDELCHVPLDPLPEALVDRIAAAGIRVVSTLATHAAEPVVLRNAAALARAGVPLAYGTDLGNAGTRPGADPAELRHLAVAGLGMRGALDSATRVAAASPGFAGRAGHRIEVGAPAALLLLDADPLLDPEALRRPVAVVCNRAVFRA